MPRLSIIIPVLGDIAPFEDTLVSVLENRPACCEIVAVLGRPYADPYDLKQEVRFVEAPPKVGWVDGVRLGIRVSRAPIVHLLGCGVEVSPGWAEIALREFDEPQVAAVAPVIFDRSEPTRANSRGVSYHRSGRVSLVEAVSDRHGQLAASREVLGPDPRAGFYRKSAIEAVGMFQAAVGDRLAGVDLALALRQAGWRCVACGDCRAYAAAMSWLAAGAFCDGLYSERLFRRWASQTGGLASLGAHGRLLGGEAVQALRRPSMVARLFGRLIGSFSRGAEYQPSPADGAPRSASHRIAAPHFPLGTAESVEADGSVRH